MSQDPLHIAFFVPSAYPVIRPSAYGEFGGMETRAWLLARALVKQGAKVSFFVDHCGAPKQKLIEGISVSRIRSPAATRIWEVAQFAAEQIEKRPGFPGIRLKKWSLRILLAMPVWFLERCCSLIFGRQEMSVIQTLVTSRSQFLITFGVNRRSVSIIRTAQAIGAKSVILLASDADLGEAAHSDDHFVSAYGEPAIAYRITFKQADLLIAQTALQASQVEQIWHRNAPLLLNPIDLDIWRNPAPKPVTSATLAHRNYILWVGRADADHKRPQIALSLAQQTPQIPWVMVLGPRSASIESALRAQAPANLQIISPIPHDEMPALFRHARLFVSTSSADLEGFPNVFLQAAASQVPIASLEVAPQWLANSQAGVCFHGDTQKLLEYLQSWASQQVTANHSPNSQFTSQFLLEHHSHDALGQRLIVLLRAALNRPIEPLN